MQLRRSPCLAVGAAVLAVALAGCSRSAQDHLERGNAYFDTGNVDAAALEYRNAVEKDPMLASARLKLAEAYMRQGNSVGAVAESVRAADLLPNDAGAQVKAGSLLLFAGKLDDAKARAERALAMSPKHIEALVLRANALAGLTDLDGAIAQIQQAIALGSTANLQTNLGVLQLAKGRREEAETAFRQAVATDPKSVTAQLALANFLRSVGRAQEAEGTLKSALALDPNNTVANRALATLYLATNRAAEAEPYFRKSADAGNNPADKLVLADYYVTMKRHADAAAVLDRLSTTPQTWALARSRVAALQYVEGKTAEAHRSIDEVIAKQPTYSDARLVRARFLVTEAKTDEALGELQQIVRSDPRNAEAHYLLATVQQAQHDLDAAAKSFAEVLRLNPLASAAQVRLAAIELERGQLGTATQLAEEAARRQPGNVGARLVLARSLLARGDVDRAATVTRELLDAFPQAGAVHSMAGLVALRKNDRAAAGAAFEKALALDPGLVEPLAGLAGIDVAQGQGGRARARFEERLQKTPGDSAVLVQAARTWAATGDAAKAEEFLRRAIQADASNFEAYELIAQLFVSQQRLGEALTEYDRLAARQPGSSGPATLAGMILLAQGKEEEARQRFEVVVEKDPRAAVAANNLAFMYASSGQQLDRALQLAQAAKTELPDHPDVNDTLAYVYIKKQLGSLAIPLLRLALEKRPDDPSFHYHLGLAYAQTGDKAAARKALEQALKLKSDFDGAADARTLLRTLG